MKAALRAGVVTLGLATCGLAMPGLMTSAVAAPVTMHFSYEIFDVSAPLTGTFSVGQTVDGWFTYDPDTSGEDYDPTASGNPLPNYRLYWGALLDYSFTAGGVSFQADTSADTRRGWVADNVDGLDRLIFDDLATVASQMVAGLTASQVDFTWDDDTLAMLTSPALPDPFPPLATTFGNLDVFFGPFTDLVRIQARLVSISTDPNDPDPDPDPDPQPVPEPAPLALLGLGLLAVPALRRRRR
ncbi:MYXO-CTERM sorting domain-containing protein [Parapedomonas caeni]